VGAADPGHGVHDSGVGGVGDGMESFSWVGLSGDN